MTDKNQTTKQTVTEKTLQRRPNETGTISVQGHIRISDPQTKKVFVEKRA